VVVTKRSVASDEREDVVIKATRSFSHDLSNNNSKATTTAARATPPSKHAQAKTNEKSKTNDARENDDADE
jgi:hypothetical protein